MKGVSVFLCISAYTFCSTLTERLAAEEKFSESDLLNGFVDGFNEASDEIFCKKSKCDDKKLISANFFIFSLIIVLSSLLLYKIIDSIIL